MNNSQINVFLKNDNKEYLKSQNLVFSKIPYAQAKYQKNCPKN